MKSLRPDWLRPWTGSNVIRLDPCGGRKELAEKLPAELRSCLAAGGHTTLMVWADCDDNCADPDGAQGIVLEQAQDRRSPRSSSTAVVFIFAKDRIENWVEFLTTGNTDESKEGPRVKHNREAAEAARTGLRCQGSEACETCRPRSSGRARTGGTHRQVESAMIGSALPRRVRPFDPAVFSVRNGSTAAVRAIHSDRPGRFIRAQAPCQGQPANRARVMPRRSRRPADASRREAHHRTRPSLPAMIVA